MQPKTENVKPKTRPLFEGKMSGESPPKKYPQSAFPDSLYLEAVRKGLRIRMGRYPAEIAEGAEVYGREGKGTYIGAVFNNCLGQLNRYH